MSCHISHNKTADIAWTVDPVTSATLLQWRILFVKSFLNNADCFDMIYSIHFITMINSLKSNTDEKYLFLMK